MKRVIKYGLAALVLMGLTNGAWAVALNDQGVVGAIDPFGVGGVASNPTLEIQWAQYLLDLGPGLINVLADADGDGNDEAYSTSTTDYSGTLTLTGSAKDDSGATTGAWVNYEFVIGKYDGPNAGIIMFNVADWTAANGAFLPEFSDTIWTNNQGAGYQLSHWVAFNPTTVPEPSMILLLGAGLVGIGFARNKKFA
jgi:hypothetical protein